jgi:hypothetical protein
MMLPRVDCLDEYAINHEFLIRRVAHPARIEKNSYLQEGNTS